MSHPKKCSGSSEGISPADPRAVLSLEIGSVDQLIWNLDFHQSDHGSYFESHAVKRGVDWLGALVRRLAHSDHSEYVICPYCKLQIRYVEIDYPAIHGCCNKKIENFNQLPRFPNWDSGITVVLGNGCYAEQQIYDQGGNFDVVTDVIPALQPLIQICEELGVDVQYD